jgi:hypothetical protein
VNGLLSEYGVNSHNFIIKFACTIVKAVGLDWHFCCMSRSWV